MLQKWSSRGLFFIFIFTFFFLLPSPSPKSRLHPALLYLSLPPSLRRHLFGTNAHAHALNIACALSQGRHYPIIPIFRYIYSHCLNRPF
ncbi:hypothetical protein E2C01_011502 [Portunus trituberculatus]|uniref:Uncharacterized protein n=1 Tax=Portunus trituberculatus TaxID=210409 RepID=A0A5B7DB96_PORTR|nr:hypothetical protein [Portunus trituberculatus]